MASLKGVSQTVTGLIFGVFEFTIFASAPIFGNYVSKIGAKFMFISGAMVCGGCAILFGVLNRGPDGTIFIVMCFLCRTLEGLGASAYVTALFAIIAHEFPSHVATVFGSLESFSGMGAMVGPPIGGALYALGGYGLPFYVNGGVVIINGILCSYLIPELEDADKRYAGSILSLLRSPLAIITAFCITTGAFSLGFLDPTLANHLLKSPSTGSGA
ncbi:hypothetical protein KUTeg_000109 [Tegillarca granosa]|uniref:Major facilitator superfamily (MFS) profile domain-containing protein n=1 Tax=Tegillarca granosa TaxID=220873 RepID=A0ABQ9FWL6_TEGGR|nr:hypothetical protein KUTeg_000109 [Tegillarca granosa]